jgi:hypothetical protein
LKEAKDIVDSLCVNGYAVIPKEIVKYFKITNDIKSFGITTSDCDLLSIEYIKNDIRNLIEAESYEKAKKLIDVLITLSSLD